MNTISSELLEAIRNIAVPSSSQDVYHAGFNHALDQVLDILEDECEVVDDSESFSPDYRVPSDILTAMRHGMIEEYLAKTYQVTNAEAHRNAVAKWNESSAARSAPIDMASL